jgi:adenylate kinase family enzyme
MEFGGAIASTPDGTEIPADIQSTIHKNQIELPNDKSATLPSTSTSSTPVSFGSLILTSGNKKHQYSVVHISIGALLRAEADRPNSPHAEEIRSVINGGQILTGKLTTSLLQTEVDRITGELSKAHPEVSPVFLVDGFPRNMDNYEHFENEMEPIKGMLLLEAAREICFERLSDRGKKAIRPDDNGFVIGVRHHTYLITTEPLVNKVRSDALKTDANAFPFFEEIDGNKGIADVYKLTRESLARFLQVYALNRVEDSKPVASPDQTSATA